MHRSLSECLLMNCRSFMSGAETIGNYIGPVGNLQNQWPGVTSSCSTNRCKSFCCRVYFEVTPELMDQSGAFQKALRSLVPGQTSTPLLIQPQNGSANVDKTQPITRAEWWSFFVQTVQTSSSWYYNHKHPRPVRWWTATKIRDWWSATWSKFHWVSLFLHEILKCSWVCAQQLNHTPPRHCLSTWGNEFREPWLQLEELQLEHEIVVDTSPSFPSVLPSLPSFLRSVLHSFVHSFMSRYRI